MENSNNFKITFTYSLCTFLTCLFLSSCTSTYRLKVSPVDQVDFYEQGREYIEKSDSVIVMVICDEASNNNELVFYVEITNIDSESIIIDPANFYYTFPGKYIVEKDTFKSLKVNSKNPEFEIDNIENSIASKEKSHETSKALNTACLCGGGLLTIFSIFSGDGENAEDGVEIMGESLHNLEDDEIIYENEMYRLEDERSFWINESFRKNTLDFEETIGGLVVFPVAKDAREITLHFPINKSDLFINYRLIWLKI